jgi:hypothetical protein
VVTTIFDETVYQGLWEMMEDVLLRAQENKRLFEK